MKNMNFLKKSLSLILSASMLAVMLAGCGSSAPAEQQTSQAAETEAPAETPAETEAATEAAAPTEAEAQESAASESTSAAESAADTAAENAAIPEYVTITDHADREVTVKTDPQRVVILSILPLPSVLTVFLNSPETIVAMQPASMAAAKEGILSELYPDIVNINTDIMNGESINIEALLEIDPDVVFVNNLAPETLAQLENAGLTTVVVSPTKWDYNCIVTYDHWIELLSQIYPSNHFDSQRIHDFSTEKYDLIQERTKDIPDEEREKVLFLFQYNENTMVTSGKSFFGQWWCDATGTKNAAESVAADNSNAVITMEQVYEWDPDMIIITNFTPVQPEDLYNNAIADHDWSTVSAVKNKRVYKMPLASYRTYTPGVDTPMTLEWMAQLAYPELFTDFDVAKDVKDYYQELYHVELTDDQIERMYHPNREAGDITVSRK